MDKLNTIITDAETALSDSSIYEAENKARMNEQLKLQGDAKSDLEDVEVAWMELQEQLEEMESQFSAE